MIKKIKILFPEFVGVDPWVGSWLCIDHKVYQFSKTATAAECSTTPRASTGRIQRESPHPLFPRLSLPFSQDWAYCVILSGPRRGLNSACSLTFQDSGKWWNLNHIDIPAPRYHLGEYSETKAKAELCACTIWYLYNKGLRVYENSKSHYVVWTLLS